MLVYRELGFALDDVAGLLDADDDGRSRRVRDQLAAVSARIDRLQQVRAALEEQMERQMSGVDLTQADKRELFGDVWIENEEGYAKEAEERWGDTDAWAQSRERTARYSKADWERATVEGEEINARFVAPLHGGEPADGEAARAVAEDHRQSICRWYYDCSYEVHAGIGRMYVQDARFTGTHEAIAPGLAAFVSQALQANAAHAGRG